MKIKEKHWFELYKALLTGMVLLLATWLLSFVVENRVSDYQAKLAEKAAYRELQTGLVVEMVTALTQAHLNRIQLYSTMELIGSLEESVSKEEIVNYLDLLAQNGDFEEIFESDKKSSIHAAALITKASVFLDAEITEAYTESLQTISGFGGHPEGKIIAKRFFLLGAKGANRGKLSDKDLLILEQSVRKLEKIWAITPEDTAKVTDFYNLIKKKFPEFYGLKPAS